jgi:predicted porin
VTVGRQTSIIFDNLAKYDPQAGSQAFSVLGYTGFTAGAGLTESARLDSVIRYSVGYGPARFAALHQFGSANQAAAGADQADVGVDLGGFSADLTYTHLSDAVSLASLTAAQATAAPGTLAGTISDNTAYTVAGRYALGPVKLYGGWEHIEFANPSHPVAVNSEAVGDYRMSVVNNTAYTIHRIEKVSWVGARYTVIDPLDLSFGYYRYDQDNYAAKPCANASSSSCSGTFQDYSLVADYRLTRRFDVYGGVNYTTVANGLASGFLQTSAVAPMMGGRFSF